MPLKLLRAGNRRLGLAPSANDGRRRNCGDDPVSEEGKWRTRHDSNV